MNTLRAHTRERERRDKEWENRVSAPRGQSRELAAAAAAGGVGGHHGPAIPRTRWGGWKRLGRISNSGRARRGDEERRGEERRGDAVAHSQGL